MVVDRGVFGHSNLGEWIMKWKRKKGLRGIYKSPWL